MGLLLVYGAPIYFHPTLNFDDTSLLTPLKKVDSFQAYSELIQKNVILDVQPIRDLSFWLELQIEKLTGFRNSQLVNVVIWFFALFFLYQTLRHWMVPRNWCYLVLCWVAFHPTVTSSVAWTSARKHLLSVLFLSILTYMMVVKRPYQLKDRLKHISVYFLLCFSQPINFLAPFLIHLHDRFFKTKSAKLFFVQYKSQLGLVLVAGFCIYVNLNYYTGDYVRQSGEMLPKFLPSEEQKLIFRFFVWGRSFYQLVDPLAASPVPYRILKSETFFGLFLLISFVGIVYKFRKKFYKDRLILALLLMASPILLMTVRLTHHLGWDTYLLSSVWALGLFGGAYRWKASPSRFEIVLGVVFSMMLAAISFHFASSWASDQKLVKQAYFKEGSFFAQENYARQLLIDGNDWTLAKDLIEDLEKKSPQRILLPYLKARLVFQAPLNPVEKRKLFLDIETSHPWVQYYFAAFEASQGHSDLGNMRLHRLWANSREDIRRVMGDLLPIYVSNWRKMCEQAEAPDCHEIRTDLF